MVHFYLVASIVGVVVPIDKELHTDDVANFMNVSKSVCILGDEKNLNSLKENIEKLENANTLFITFENEFDNLLSSGLQTYKKRLYRF